MEIKYHQKQLLISTFDRSKFKIWKSNGRILVYKEKKNQKNVFLVWEGSI